MSESDGKACRKWWHRERAGVHEIVDAQGDVLVRESTQRDAVLDVVSVSGLRTDGERAVEAVGIALAL